MSFRSLFSLLALTLIAACNDEGGSLTKVPPDQYTARNCWYDRLGNFEAFVVLATDRGVAVPYPISATCIISDKDQTDFEKITFALNAIRLLDQKNVLKPFVVGVILSNNLRTDQPTPYPNDKIYFIKSKGDQFKYGSKNIFVPRNVLVFRDTGINWRDFLRLSDQGRAKLLKWK